MQEFRKVRREFVASLSKIKGLRILPTQANYVMCEVLFPCGAKKLTETLLDQHHILIKDLSSKKGINGKQYIRIAVNPPWQNEHLLKALEQLSSAM